MCQFLMVKHSEVSFTHYSNCSDVATPLEYQLYYLFDCRMTPAF
jgi:hypothetical protein